MRGWNLTQAEKEYCRSSKMTLANREDVMAERDLHCSKRETRCRAHLVGREETKEEHTTE